MLKQSIFPVYLFDRYFRFVFILFGAVYYVAMLHYFDGFSGFRLVHEIISLTVFVWVAFFFKGYQEIHLVDAGVAVKGDDRPPIPYSDICFLEAVHYPFRRYVSVYFDQADKFIEIATRQSTAEVYRYMTEKIGTHPKLLEQRITLKCRNVSFTANTRGLVITNKNGEQLMLYYRSIDSVEFRLVSGGNAVGPHDRVFVLRLNEYREGNEIREIDGVRIINQQIRTILPYGIFNELSPFYLKLISHIAQNKGDHK